MKKMRSGLLLSALLRAALLTPTGIALSKKRRRIHVTCRCPRPTISIMQSRVVYSTIKTPPCPPW